jgi:serine protease DegS
LIGGVVDGGPGAKAGLEKGDVLISLGGNRVDQRSLGRQLSRIGAGEKVAAVVVRNGERKKLTLVLGERPQRP